MGAAETGSFSQERSSLLGKRRFASAPWAWEPAEGGGKEAMDLRATRQWVETNTWRVKKRLGVGDIAAVAV